MSRLSSTLFSVCGVWLVGLGLYFMLLRPPLLPEDVRYIGTNLTDIQTAIPGLARWLHRVFTVMGGFISGAGVLTIVTALNGPAAQQRWTRAAVVVAGLLTVGTMTATNFVLASDFRFLLLLPSLLWTIAVVFYATGRMRG